MNTDMIFVWTILFVPIISGKFIQIFNDKKDPKGISIKICMYDI